MDFVIKVMPKGELELPDEIKAQLRPGDEYEVSLIEDSIVLKKIQKDLDIKEWFRIIEELSPDPNQPTLEEISKIVKEVRR
ncbi:MAG: hypothetical protein HWQ38_35560 [Nostoc sp. NMS7]|uniref:hypothetical protein n=1 Tax=Nostoc sp. NMS7 TaxID=2815391 RepID=UPI0025E7F665|nr:hypothetical protein [Nostoc sp. NMS7]MBN3951505.1 hypothetical protein [Nostoc sp. NMS7]